MRGSSASNGCRRRTHDSAWELNNPQWISTSTPQLAATIELRLSRNTILNDVVWGRWWFQCPMLHSWDREISCDERAVLRHDLVRPQGERAQHRPARQLDLCSRRYRSKPLVNACSLPKRAERVGEEGYFTTCPCRRAYAPPCYTPPSDASSHLPPSRPAFLCMTWHSWPYTSNAYNPYFGPCRDRAYNPPLSAVLVSGQLITSSQIKGEEAAV